MARFLEAVHGRWPVIARDGLIVTGGSCLSLGALAMVATWVTIDPDIARSLVAGAVGLTVAGGAMVLRVGQRFVTAVLSGLTGGAFAIVLADLTSTPIDAPGRYSALRWVVLLAMTVIGLVGFQDGFRRLDSPRMPASNLASPTRPQVPRPRGKGRRRPQG